jgi:hypothetical protein
MDVRTVPLEPNEASRTPVLVYRAKAKLAEASPAAMMRPFYWMATLLGKAKGALPKLVITAPPLPNVSSALPSEL